MFAARPAAAAEHGITEFAGGVLEFRGHGVVPAIEKTVQADGSILAASVKKQ